MDSPKVVDDQGNVVPDTTCVTATQVLDLNEDECDAFLALQCPESCNVCNPPTVSPTTSQPTRRPSLTPSNLPSVSPTILCEDVDIVVDGLGVPIEGTDCYAAGAVLVLNGLECTELIALQCPLSCGLCSLSPTAAPSSSLPSVTPTTPSPSDNPASEPTKMPTLSPTRPKPSTSPFITYECGDDIGQCNDEYLRSEADLVQATT